MFANREPFSKNAPNRLNQGPAFQSEILDWTVELEWRHDGLAD
jgi:hypothetical protein